MGGRPVVGADDETGRESAGVSEGTTESGEVPVTISELICV